MNFINIAKKTTNYCSIFFLTFFNSIKINKKSLFWYLLQVGFKMQKTTIKILFFSIFLLLVSTAYAIQPPKNVIIMIGDGMGRPSIQITNYFMEGRDSVQEYEKFPVKIYCSTYPGGINKSGKFTTSYDSRTAWSDFEYLKIKPTDSAPAATAISTGRKTYDGAIGMSLDTARLLHFFDIAKLKGRAIGVVTSVPIPHATPAGFLAHNVSRNNYSQIAQEMIDSKADVIIGCGHPDFDDNGDKAEKSNYDYVGGIDYWNKLLNGYNGWKLIQSKEEFEQEAKKPSSKRLFGVPKVRSTLQQGRKGDINANPFEVPFIPTVPDLSTMSLAALNTLNQNKSGFCVMIEGGAIDWAGHGNLSGRLVEEVNDFNKAVNTVLKWVEQNSNWDETLLIVTADHETGYITGPNENANNPYTNPIINNGKGKLPSFKWNSKNHTNSLVPFYAKGKYAPVFKIFADEYDLVYGPFISNSEISIALKLLFNFENMILNPEKSFIQSK